VRNEKIDDSTAGCTAIINLSEKEEEVTTDEEEKR
jgi:hypothetical protein